MIYYVLTVQEEERYINPYASNPTFPKPVRHAHYYSRYQDQ